LGRERMLRTLAFVGRSDNRGKPKVVGAMHVGKGCGNLNRTHRENWGRSGNPGETRANKLMSCWVYCQGRPGQGTKNGLKRTSLYSGGSAAASVGRGEFQKRRTGCRTTTSPLTKRSKSWRGIQEHPE